MYFLIDIFLLFQIILTMLLFGVKNSIRHIKAHASDVNSFV